MLSIGGHPFVDNNLGIYTPDPFAQGLGIFDMTALQWKSEYDANAEEYKTAAIIKDWYRENGSSPENWNDPAVQRLFEKPSTTTPGSPAGTIYPSPSPTSTTLAASPSNFRNSNDGAIAGYVLAGFGGIALIAGIALWIRRREHNQHNAPPPMEQRPDDSPGEEIRDMQELPETCRPLEMEGSQHHTVELDGQGLSYLRGQRRMPRPSR